MKEENKYKFFVVDPKKITKSLFKIKMPKLSKKIIKNGLIVRVDEITDEKLSPGSKIDSNNK